MSADGKHASCLSANCKFGRVALAAGAGYLGAASAIGRQIRVRLGLGVTVIVPQAVATGRAGCWTCAGRKTLPQCHWARRRGDSEVVGSGGEGHRTGIGKLAQARAARDIDGPRRHAGLRAAPGPRRMASPTGGTDGTVVIYKKKCAHALAALCALVTNEAPAR